MKRKEKIIVSILCMVSILFVTRSESYAAPAYIDWDKTPSGLYFGDMGKAGNLRYGMGLYYNKDADGQLLGSPNVQYYSKNKDKNIDHLHRVGFLANVPGADNSKIGQVTTPPFHIIETDEEYKSSQDAQLGLSHIDSAGFTTGGIGSIIENNEVTAVGKKRSSNDFVLRVKMSSDKKKTTVLHEYEVENTSNKTKVIYPFKFADTLLNDNDKVNIYSRGPGKGLYIEEDEFRLDYVTDIPNGPKYYQGSKINAPYSNVFGPDFNNQSTVGMDYPEGEKVFPLSEDTALGTEDSAMYLSWGRVELGPKEKKTFSYGVAIRPMDALIYDKKVNNHTNNDGKYRVGDEIEFVGTVKNDKPEHYPKINIKEHLPNYLDVPSKVEVIKSDGSKLELNMTDPQVYNPSDPTNDGKPTITLPEMDMLGDSTITLSITTKILPEASGKLLTSETVAEAENSQGGLQDFTGSGAIDVLVEEIKEGTVNVYHQDMRGNNLIPKKVLTGIEGESYTAEKETLFGYEFVDVLGNPGGQFTDGEQDVIYQHEAADPFTFKQEVFNTAGISVDRGTVSGGDVLTYKTSVSLNHDYTEYEYKQLSMEIEVDPNLINVTNVTLTNKAGQSVGRIEYNPDVHAVLAHIIDTDHVTLDEIVLTYDGTVATKLPEGTKVKGKTRSTVEVDSLPPFSNVTDSNTVESTLGKGDLEFTSAPETMNFGDNVKISSKHEIYEVKNYDKNLTVTDYSGVGNRWKLTANLLTEMTNGDKTLPGSLEYVRNGVATVLQTNASTLIYEKETTSIDPVIISDSWGSNDKLQLKVAAGSARKGQFQGAIQWNLQNVP